MTWKERRTISMLLTIIAVLFAALLIVFGMRYREGREEALAEKGGGDASLASGGISAAPGTYTGLRYYNGSVSLSFNLDEEGNWVWADGPDFPLNDSTVSSILDTLSNLKFQQVLPASESKEEYGLEEPSATLTASGAEGEQSLAFGKTTTDGNSYYMMMNGNESTVYIVADTLVQLMKTPIYDMCALPELPDLNELNLRAITIQGSAPVGESSESGDGEDSGEGGDPQPVEEPQRPTVSLNARRSNGDSQPALWFDGSDNVTASALLQDLLYDLRTLSMAKCVDYYPSGEAEEICGFQNPDAILKVDCAAGVDQTFTLRVGARMPDESGRYVQLEEGGPIYALSTDSLDAIMTISVAGMRGAVQDSGQEGGQENGEE